MRLVRQPLPTCSALRRFSTSCSPARCPGAFPTVTWSSTTSSAPSRRRVRLRTSFHRRSRRLFIGHLLSCPKIARRCTSVPMPTKPEPVTPTTPEPVATKSQARGRLTVHADPYADVWIDGRCSSTTPIVDLVLPVGRHRVRGVHAHRPRPAPGDVFLHPPALRPVRPLHRRDTRLDETPSGTGGLTSLGKRC